MTTLTSPRRETSLPLTLLLFSITLVLSVLFANGAEANNVHGNYISNQDYCSACHNTHEASGKKLEKADKEQGVCYYCHGSSGPSQYDIRSQFGETNLGSSTKASYHPIVNQTIRCTDCHNPHKDPVLTPGLLSAGSNNVSSGNEFCGACHGSGSALTGGNIFDRYQGTPHDANLATPASSKNIVCFRCHEPHGSDIAKLLSTSIKDNNNIASVVTGNNNTVCYSCHTSGAGAYSGKSVYTQAAHGTVTSSTKALVKWPGSNYTGTLCLNCHDPHGTGNNNYLRAQGNSLCQKCHDDSSVTRPDEYSYRGITAYNNTPHSSARPAPGTYLYNLGSTGGEAWESTTEPTPTNKPANAATFEQITQASTNDTSRWSTDLSKTDGNYNYQMFKIPVKNNTVDISKLTVKWIGYGEPTANYPTALYIWNISTSTWEQIDNKVIGTETTITKAFTANFANYINGSKEIYIMAKARHDVVSPNITVNPTATNTATTATIIWTTDEYSNSYVEYGTNTNYGSTTGNNDLVKNHSVNISGLTQGQNYHYRVHSTDSLGNEEISGDFTLDTTAPTITSTPTASNTTGSTAYISWNTNEGSTTYVDYGLTNSYGSTAGNNTLTSSHGVTITGLQSGMVYQYRVRSVDARGNQVTSGNYSFRSNTPPNAPTVIDETNIMNGSYYAYPRLEWNGSTDIDAGDWMQYYAQISTSSSFSYISSYQNWSTALYWDATVSNYYQVTWYWRVKAKDNWGAESGWSTPDSFVHDGGAEPPPDPGCSPILSSWEGAESNNTKSAPAKDTFIPENHYSLNTNYIEVEIIAEDLSIVSGTCTICHAPHGKTTQSGSLVAKQLNLAEENTCFGGGYGCHSDANNSVQKVNISASFTANSNRNAHHSVTDAEQAAGGSKVECANCHDPHLNNSSDKLVDPDNRDTVFNITNNGIPNYVGPNGEIFVLAEAKHDGIVPTITTGPAVSGITATNSTITWSTNEPSTSYIEYGTTTAYGTITGDSNLVTAHTVNLTGLTQGQNYHFRVRTADALGNEKISPDYTLDSTAPTLTSGPAVTFIDPTSYKIDWGTNEPGTSWVDYGLTTEYGSTLGNNTLTGTHSVVITGMVQGNTYNYQVRSTDARGNEYIGPNKSFKASVPPTVPSFIDEPNFTGSYSGTATLNWNASTDTDPGDTIQYYCEVSTVSNFSSIYANSGWISAQSFNVSFNHYGAVTYYWRIKAKDNWGLESAWSTADSFVFDGGAEPPPDYGCSPVLPSWDGAPSSSSGRTFEEHYSLNTNFVQVRTSTMNKTGTYTPANAWNSGGTVKPTPTDPGAAVSADALTTSDANRLITDLTLTDSAYNYQMYKFSGNEKGSDVRSLYLTWTGYGEPTPGYPVNLYIWNFTTGTWEKLTGKDLGTEGTMNWSKFADFQSYCNKCHDNSPPAGVVLGNIINIAATYPNDAHGGKSGPLYSTAGTLKTPFQRAMAPISCSECHDPHGTSNAYHFKTNINGNPVTVSDSNNAAQVEAYCKSCHVGSVTQFHNSCVSCHNGAHGNAPTDINTILYGPATNATTCLSCHQHGKTFNFPGHGECYYHSCVPGDMKAF